MKQEDKEALEKAFEAVCNMYFAAEKDNHSSCSSFHIKPFNTHWDKQTVKEVIEDVKIYLGTWVISPMEYALNKDRHKVEREAKKYYRQSQKRKKTYSKK